MFYQGMFSDSFSEHIVALAEHDNHKTVKKRLSFLMIEVFQNIVRHGGQEEKSNDFFGVRSIEDSLNIFSSNRINKKAHQFLSSKLKELNKLNADQLKTLYKEILQSGQFSDKGGAGLGLIDMARKSGNPIQHNFEPLENDDFQFNYQLDLSSERGVELTKYQKINIEDNIQSFNDINDNDLVFFFKGDFSKNNTQSLLNILKANTQTYSKNEEFNNFRIFHSGVELIQNIARHGKSVNEYIEGVFCLFRVKSGIYICTGNSLKTGDYSSMEMHINKINEYSKDDLNKVYLETLKKNALNDDVKAGVGLIDVRRYNQSFIDYEINNKDNGLYLKMGVFIPIYK